MPQYSTYPPITLMAAADKILIHQISSGTEKTIAYSDFIRTSQPFINVLDYGAKGDGSTDDSPAISSALNAATPGSVIFFPPTANGYVMTTQLNIPISNITLLGFGAKITGLNQSQFRKFFVSSKTNVTFNGLNFDGLYTSGTAASAEASIEISSSNDIIIKNCRFENVFNSGIYIVGSSSRILIEANLFSVYFTAIFTDNNGSSQPTYIRIINNEFRPGYASNTTGFSGAIKMSGTGDLNSIANHLISNNQIDSPGEMGIELQTVVNGCSVVGNTIYNAGFGISLSGVFNGVVSGNTIKAANSIGIEIASSGKCSVTGNSVDGADLAGTQATDRGIQIDQSSDTSVVGNTVYKAPIYLFATTLTTIIGNAVTGTGDAIYIQASPLTSVIGNIINGFTGSSTGIVVDVSGGSSIIRGVTIKDNTFIGSFGLFLVSFFSSSGTAQLNGIVLSGNNAAIAIAGLEGVAFSFGGSTTAITNYRSFGNIPNSAAYHQSSLDTAGSCTVHLTANFSILNTTETTVTWNDAYFDDSSSPFSGRKMWDAGTPTKLIVPPYAHRVRVSANIRWEPSGTGSRKIRIKSSNPAGVYPLNATWACSEQEAGALANDSGSSSITTPIIDVQNITDFTVTAEQDSGGPLYLRGETNFVPGTSFCLQILD